MNETVRADSDLGRPGEEGGRADDIKTEDRGQDWGDFKFTLGPDRPRPARVKKDQNDLLGPVYRAVADHQVSCEDWPNHEPASWLQDFAHRMIKRFGLEIPVPPIRIEPTNIKSPGAFRPGRDGYALQGALIFNEKWLRAESGAPVLTPYQRLILLAKLLFDAWRYWHRRGREECREKMKEIGLRFYADSRIALLPPDKFGRVGLFQELLAQEGIELPPDAFFPEPPEGKGKSTLALWSCWCELVRLSGERFDARCNHCGMTFRPGDHRRFRWSRESGKYVPIRKEEPEGGTLVAQ